MRIVTAKSRRSSATRLSTLFGRSLAFMSDSCWWGKWFSTDYSRLASLRYKSYKAATKKDPIAAVALGWQLISKCQYGSGQFPNVFVCANHPVNLTAWKFSPFRHEITPISTQAQSHTFFSGGCTSEQYISPYRRDPSKCCSPTRVRKQTSTIAQSVPSLQQAVDRSWTKGGSRTDKMQSWNRGRTFKEQNSSSERLT